MLSRRHCPCSASRLIPWAASCSRRRSTIALPDDHRWLRSAAQCHRRRCPSGAAPPAAASRATIAVEDLQRTHLTVDEDELRRRVVGGAGVSASATRQSTVVLIETEEGEHAAAAVAASSSGGSPRSVVAVSPGSVVVEASSPICSNWSVEIPHCVIRSISAVRSFHVDPADVGDETVGLLGGQAHVGEDVRSRGRWSSTPPLGRRRSPRRRPLHRQGRQERGRRRTRRSRFCACGEASPLPRSTLPPELPAVCASTITLLFHRMGVA